MEQQYVIGVLVANISGVLSRVSGMFTRRGFNIDSLTVSKIDAFIDLMKAYGIMEMCRTGIVALERGENCLRTRKEQQVL